jgi:hypothetical protein
MKSRRVQRSSRLPDRLHLHGSSDGIPQYRSARELWIALDQHLHPLRREVWKVEEHAGEVAAGTRESGCHTAGNRVTFQVDGYNRNSTRGRAGRVHYQRPSRYYQVHIFPNNFSYQRSDVIRVAVRGSGHNLNLCGSGVAGSPKPGRDRLHASGHHRFGPRIDKTDSWDLRRLLRGRRERPCGSCPADKRDELAPFQLSELHPLPLARVAA